jgi:hypothetical protein
METNMNTSDLPINRKQATGRLILASGVALAVLGLAPSIQAHEHEAGAKVCYVDKIKYSNHGAYSVAGLTLMYVKPNGNKFDFGYSYYPALNQEIGNGASLSVDLNHFNGKSGEGSVLGQSYPPLKEGDEVWVSIPIVMGNNKTCHKDGHKLVYKKDVNTTMKFKSSGTTLNDNRCKADGNMDDMCYTGD